MAARGRPKKQIEINVDAEKLDDAEAVADAAANAVTGSGTVRHKYKQGSKRPNRSEKIKKDMNTIPAGCEGAISNAMELFNLEDIDTDDPPSVRQRTAEYFAICERNNMRPSVSGYAFALGVSRQTLYNWVNDLHDKPRDVIVIIKKAYNMLSIMMEDWMQTGKINPVSGIFLMKNNFGYADKQEVIVKPVNLLGDAADPAALEQKYVDAIPATFDDVEGNED